MYSIYARKMAFLDSLLGKKPKPLRIKIGHLRTTLTAAGAEESGLESWIEGRSIWVSPDEITSRGGEEAIAAVRKVATTEAKTGNLEIRVGDLEEILRASPDMEQYLALRHVMADAEYLETLVPEANRATAMEELKKIKENE